MFMKRVIRIALMALVALAVMVPAHAAGKVTVGGFLTQIAHVQNLQATDGATAAASLRSAGVNLPALDLNAPLTEGTVAQVAGSLGLTVTTSNPQAPFGQPQVDAFVSSFGDQFGKFAVGAPTVSPNAPTFDPKSKGKKKGHTKSRSEPI
jgi:hypothetical protein